MLSERQHGLLKTFSCESQFIDTVSELTTFNNLSSQVDIIVLDVSKAFDTVSHQRLIHDLCSYGLNNNVLVNWIKWWFDGRTFSIITDDDLLSFRQYTRSPTVLGLDLYKWSVAGYNMYRNTYPIICWWCYCALPNPAGSRYSPTSTRVK